MPIELSHKQYHLSKRFLRTIYIAVFACVFLQACKKDYDCRCTCYDIVSGQTTEVHRETISDTEKNAKEKCESKWVGDECGCSIL